METYRAVGREAGLTEFRLDFYVSYMTQRWADTERQKCLDGYAKEWAIRWLTGHEWTASDSFGKMLVKNIYEEHWKNY